MPDLPTSAPQLAKRRWLAFLLLAASFLQALGPGTQASELRRTPIVRAVERAKASVVNIHGEKTLRAADADFRGENELRHVNGMGTGVVIDPRGYIITNYHVVEGVRKIQITMADRTNYVARLVSSDNVTDLAIIKIDAEQPLAVMPLGTSSDLMLGEPVIAVGNAYGYEHTVTRGIISALHRSVQVTDAQSYDDLIQTDASINPGNSGGPLMNIDGELIGINVAVRAGAQGIGFAIPADAALEVAARLLSTERLDKTWHGVVARSRRELDCGGLLVESTVKGSPAEQLDLKSGDVILQVGQEPVNRKLDLERALLGRPAGEPIELMVERNGRSMNLQLALARLPDEMLNGADPTWEVLGLKLESISPKMFQQFRTRYRGGLAVKAVRPHSPAAQQGITQGDVLVGMHIWETISLDNVRYILNRPDFNELAPLKFYILRGSETLYGHLQASLERP